MVAISLYRGNLHRLPDVPRRWVVPRPRISLKSFRGLLRRRSKALSLLKAVDVLASTTSPSTTANGNPSPPPSLPPLPPPHPQQQRRPDRQSEEANLKPRAQDLSSPTPLQVDESEETANPENRKADDVAAELANLVMVVVPGDSEDSQVEENKVKVEEEDREKKVENFDSIGAFSDKEKRKREVEEKLEILNKKKHNLVQALKQILSAEEELKRRSSLQTARPSISLQLDMSNDSGSKMASEADNCLNHDSQSRQVPRMSSISPSAESSLKRPFAS